MDSSFEDVEASMVDTVMRTGKSATHRHVLTDNRSPLMMTYPEFLLIFIHTLVLDVIA